MRRIARENALCASIAAAGCAVMAWLSLYGFAWNDYELEARPAFEALVHWHLLGFLRLAPAYGGSLVLRAPFALSTDLWGGGELAVYRMVALPCLLAGGALGIWLVARMRSRGAPVWWRAVALGICVANPITLRALELGHPEELLGAVLCVAAVVLADRNRPLLAGLALGMAIANKEWALLAIGPVLLALHSRRTVSMLLAGAVAAALTAPLLFVGSGSFAGAAKDAASPASVIFQPMQIFWFFGHHSSSAARLLGAEKYDFRLAPMWIGQISHLLVIAVAFPLTWLAWRLRPRNASAGAGGAARVGTDGLRRALLLLALLLLTRCMLDTWDNVYYPLPFVIALLTWEAEALSGPPILALCATVAVWFNGWLSLHVSTDLQALFFIAWSLPLAAKLAVTLYAPELLGTGSPGASKQRQGLVLAREAH